MPEILITTETYLHSNDQTERRGSYVATKCIPNLLGYAAAVNVTVAIVVGLQPFAMHVLIFPVNEIQQSLHRLIVVCTFMIFL